MRRIARLTLVVAAVLTAPSTAVAYEHYPQRFFKSPIQGMECELKDGPTASAFCETMRPEESATLYSDGQMSRCIGSGCVGNGPVGETTLAYGHSVSLGGFRCTSLRTGVRCTAAGHGFLISRSRILQIRT